MPAINVLGIQEVFVRSSRKSILTASCELHTRIPCSTTYNIQIVQVLRETACDKDRNFLIEMLDSRAINNENA
jgi:hypothetical protein